jgi:carbon-monoxide dehydrogenase large subunit
MDDKTRPDESGYRFIGKPMPRKEDARLITGKGRFTDDFNLDGQTYAAMVRSPFAPPTSLGRSRTIRCPRPNST